MNENEDAEPSELDEERDQIQHFEMLAEAVARHMQQIASQHGRPPCDECGHPADRGMGALNETTGHVMAINYCNACGDRMGPDGLIAAAERRAEQARRQPSEN